MFQVTKVRRRFLTQRVQLDALEEMNGVETIVNPAPHGLMAYKVPYGFAPGTTIELGYPFWRRVQIGALVSAETVLKHPHVQRLLFRIARGQSDRTALTS